MSPRKEPPTGRGRALGPAGWIAVTIGLSVLGCIGLDIVYRARGPDQPPEPPRYACVRLMAVPAWLPLDLAYGVLDQVQQAAEGRAITDPDLARDVYLAAADNPWMAQVQRVVKNQDGTVEVHARYRRPFALAVSAQRPDATVVVDAEGVVLPIGPDRLERGAFVVIREVAAPAPPPGGTWPGNDLRDGLRLLDLLKDRPYVAEITTIDVRNHAGGVPGEPQVRLRAETPDGRATDVRFGRFPAADGLDYCLSPERRMDMLDYYVRTNGGRLAGTNAFVDLRYDQLHVSLR